MNVRQILNGFFTERELFEYIDTKALWVVVKEENLLSVTFIVILISCLNNKFIIQKWQICYSTQ
jgi:hypothetical protein